MKNSVLNISVSGFANAKSTEPKAVNLLTWLTSEKYQQQVERIRQAETKEERTRLKQSLPAITPSGTFTRRNLAGLVKHSGLLCLDIDHQDNKEIGNFADLKKHLSNIQNFAFVGLSVSGAGYFCLVPIERPDLHKLHFEALQNDLQRFGITIDNSGSDITRLRFYSYDPEAYFNHNATIYSKLHQEPPPKPQRTQRTQRTQTANNNSENHFQTLLNKITSTSTDITSGYQAWFEIGCGLANEFGEAGRSYFNDISRFNAGYNGREADRQFNHCLKHSYQFSIKTFFHYCQLHGVTLDKPENKPKVQRMQRMQRVQSANNNSENHFQTDKPTNPQPLKSEKSEKSESLKTNYFLTDLIRLQFKNWNPYFWIIEPELLPGITKYNLQLLSQDINYKHGLTVTPVEYLQAYQQTNLN